MKDNVNDRILAGFNRLVKRTDFSSLTVGDICKEAGVSRATFYRHFKDKYDVMNYNFRVLIEKHSQSGQLHTLKDLFVRLLKDGRSTWKDLLPLFATEGINSLHAFIYDFSFDTAKRLYECGSFHDTGSCYRKLNSHEILQMRVFSHGVAQFFEDWIRGNYSLSAEEAAEDLYEILPASLKGNLFIDAAHPACFIEDHALLCGLLVKHARLILGDPQGTALMKKVFVLYGNRRGQRMAFHAAERNLGTSADAYMLCGEWKGKTGENRSETFYEDDCVRSHVTKCAWLNTWEKYGLLSEGPLYCTCIDKAIAQGFAGSFTLSVEKTLSYGDPYCEFVYSSPVDPDQLNQKRSSCSDLILPFDFHCRELLACADEVLSREIPEKKESMMAAVREEFTRFRPKAQLF